MKLLRGRLLLAADGSTATHAHVGVLGDEAFGLLEAVLGPDPVMRRERALILLARDRWPHVRVEP